MSRKLILVAVAALALAAPSRAAADGLPSGVEADPGGVTTPQLDVNYIVVPAGRGTLLGRVAKGTGRLTTPVYLRSRFVIPAVAADGTPGGLSGDGRTLVLIRPRSSFPQNTTRLMVIDGARLRIRRTLKLRGDFSYDAISPDGGTLFLIQYTSRRDFTRYAVRAYDLRAGRLVPGRIIDRREPDEDMSGYPVTRANSADGRWAYTLYDGAEHPFVHALDTVSRRAYCIDLDGLAKDDLFEMRLTLRNAGRTLAVTSGRGKRLEVDTRTFQVSAPAALGERRASDRDEGGALPWTGIGGGAALVAAGAGLAAARRRRRVLAGA